VWSVAIFVPVAMSLGCERMRGDEGTARPGGRNDALLKAQLLTSERKPVVLPQEVAHADAFDREPGALAAVLAITPDALVARLDHFRLRTKMSLETQGDQAQVLSEQVWNQASSGNFSTHHQAQEGSVDWLIVDKHAYVKNGHGGFRSEPYRLEQIDNHRRLLLSDLRELVTLFGDRVKLGPARAEEFSSRPAFSYVVDTAPAKTGKVAISPLLGDEVEAQGLNGKIVVDKAEGVVLGAELKAVVLMKPITPAAPQAAFVEGAPSVPTRSVPVTIKLSYVLDNTSTSALASLEPHAPRVVIDVGRVRPPAEPLSFWKASQPKTNEEQDEEE
jgi:hypothetical protein